MKGPALILGALLALPLAAPADAAAMNSKTTNSAAYPKAPGGTPSASDKGKPIKTKGACKGSKCPAKPAPSGAASTEGTKPGGVRTPSTAYPGSPVKTPSTNTDGKAPR